MDVTSILNVMIAEKKPATMFPIPFSLRILESMRKTVVSESSPIAILGLSLRAFADLTSNADFAKVFSPDTDLVPDISEGKLGSVFGMDVITDALFHPMQRCFPYNASATLIVASFNTDGKLIKSISVELV